MVGSALACALGTYCHASAYALSFWCTCSFNWLTIGCTPATRHLRIGLIESSTPAPLHPLSSLPEVRVVSVNPASVRLLQGLAIPSPIFSKMKWQPFRLLAKHLDSFSLLLSHTTHYHYHTSHTITHTHTHHNHNHNHTSSLSLSTHIHTFIHTPTHTIPIDQEQLLGLGIASPMHVWLPFTPWKYA